MTDLLEVRDRRAWRAWLRKNHAASKGVWLVFYKGRPRPMEHEDALRDALCFGWIDSLIKRLDDARYAVKFTPRKTTSRWSEANRKRWSELKEQGLLQPAGLAAAPTVKSYAPKPKIPALPRFIANAFKKNDKAWRFFRELPPGQQRLFVVWIATAKRPETRAKRVREAIALLAAGTRLGLR